MVRIRLVMVLAGSALLAWGSGRPARATLTRPWDDLVADPDANWIFPSTVNIYAANTPTAFPVGFGSARSDGGARGMNSLRFVNEGDTHHVARATTGSVDVLASGGVPFSDAIILIAIDATALPDNFALSMNGYTCDPAADFVYYDGTQYASGRPTGYYPGGTNPESEPIAYDFDKGMVTVLAFENVVLEQGTNYTLDYAFENLPGRAVFSVYGFPDGGTEIYHTNRGLADVNVPDRAISTFEVAPLAGDANGDGVVDAADYVLFKSHFGEDVSAGVSAGDFDNNGVVGAADLEILAGGFSAAGANILPEPATAMLLLFSAAIFRPRRLGQNRIASEDA